MTFDLTAALRRIGAVALLLAVPLLCYAAVVAPLASHRASLDEDLARLEDSLARYKAFAAERPRLAEALAAAEAAEPDTGLYLEGASDALAAARLQDLLNAIVERNGGRLDSVRVLPSASEAGYRRVAVEVFLEGRLEALRDILYSVETEKPFLFVRNLDIAVGGRFQTGAEAQAAQELEVRLEVYAYRNGDAS
ncbi:type II secretion system protein GspM [Pelagibius sp. 7325]|uniref:type II secretion system protein GspM n=1 Tax=Pelagibius sp. 7325 TaxID=3131994 RepID=UPI0030EC187D